eukprot:CAMPEP_0113936880 /NCGR_PEP_ID=MMETSP1339-20121228/3638_1 /TAXON_ID=94617 /ORGANISM="Fibrocapsa japonica" /LENGTH=257 /DNA_ID=CAMNT_0000939449 /DNA_START=196 /DNA_END=969 /DNA_ORIENTATION=+ /assembly_acc=CAM_ASM_000762
MAKFHTSDQEILSVKKLSENATIPVRGSVDAAGFDLSSAVDTTVPAGGKALIKTDLSIAIPQNTYARIAPRSGLAWKKHIDVGAGVIDYDYRGPVGVVLFNHASEDFAVAKGDRVAQLIIERICMAEVVEVDDLPETARGAGGFGSTGVAGPAANGGATTGAPTTEGEGEPPAAKVRVVEAAAPPAAEDKVQAMAQLLAVVNDIDKECGDGSKEVVQKVRAAVVSEDMDVRLQAALLAYKESPNLGSFFETVKLIFP